MEKVFVLIKPDGLPHSFEIIDAFCKIKMHLNEIKVINPKRHIIKEHYKHIKDKPFFQDTIKYMMGDFHKTDMLLAMVWEGENAIKKCRDITGSTNPQLATKGSLRKKYGTLKNGRIENVLHVSSSVTDAEKEIKLWMKK